MDHQIIREHLRKLLLEGQAHVDWKSALKGLPDDKRGVRPAGSPHSAWELLEHVRIAQWDILEFLRIQGMFLRNGPRHIGLLHRNRQTRKLGITL